VLNLDAVIFYLLERGMAVPESVVGGRVRIVEFSRRNRNFAVMQDNQPGYFLKQARRWDPEALRGVQVEAQCYEFARDNPDFADLARIMPRFHSYDPRRSVLVTELLDGAETIDAHHFRNESFPVHIAEQLGDAFGRYHRKATAMKDERVAGLFPRRVPWALTLHRMAAEGLPGLSGGIYQLLGMVQQFPQFGTALESLQAGWRAGALIHGDIKWENCLLCPDANGGTQLKIVDWEMAHWGDPCWDVAAIFSAYLSFWVQSLPAADLGNADALVAQARFPVERMQPAMRAFWTTYRKCLKVRAQQARALLDRTVRYAGVRLIQTAFEYLQQAPQMYPMPLLLLQLSMNVLTDPAEARHELLGIEAG